PVGQSHETPRECPCREIPRPAFDTCPRQCRPVSAATRCPSRWRPGLQRLLWWDGVAHGANATQTTTRAMRSWQSTLQLHTRSRQDRARSVCPAWLERWKIRCLKIKVEARRHGQRKGGLRGAWRAGAFPTGLCFTRPIDLAHDKNYNSCTREPKTRTDS